ncbi:MAG TPA: FAD-binding protein [Acidimicrobiia bacterium]|nr:FAD-binding protein [Acidimicrobiia bacterium]
MDLTATRTETDVQAAVGTAGAVDPVGGGTHRAVGNPVLAATPVAAPVGIVSYDPAELTVTVGAGTRLGELDAALQAEHQECVLDGADPTGTVGGLLAVGLSGHRRLRYGPLRDRVLEVRFVAGDGHVVRGGGPTVKNVTGYDLPRLLVGSFGTLGVLTRVILRCQPQPPSVGWFATALDPAAVRARCFQPSTIFWHPAAGTRVLLEGHPDDVAAQARAASLLPADGPPPRPAGPHQGRISVRPDRVEALGHELASIGGLEWVAEWGVGTVHVAAPTVAAVAAARAAAHAAGGWLLRTAGAPELDGFGVELPNGALMARIKAAFDPHGKLAPGRLPIPHPEREAS